MVPLSRRESGRRGGQVSPAVPDIPFTRSTLIAAFSSCRIVTWRKVVHQARARFPAAGLHDGTCHCLARRAIIGLPARPLSPTVPHCRAWGHQSPPTTSTPSPTGDPMRRLLLARHAKSSWGDPSLADHDRPLNKRGRRAAPLVAATLADRGFVPDAVQSSSACRTRETWEFMAPHLGGHPHVEFLSELYLASPRAVLRTIATAPASAHTLMVLGHNPSTHALAAYLARTGDQEKRDRIIRSFPTGAVAVVELAGDDWSDAGTGGELLDYVIPKMLC
ncbi:MAG: histidine phosphatase family protein [Gemmatimonadetes bacterium]|nr:histidine phosphatase family protein [Gemmatimonadota bacterium]MYB99031.1 histidine phosphatase family protein [Gemmatimonadota bacterium]MYI46754.1 histidine phosphatase family protein [Gemmatimonadota bacterium]